MRPAADHPPTSAPDLAAPLAALDWPALALQLERQGYARTGPLLTPAQCAELAALFDDDARFRSRVQMARYRFGEGDYGYFAHPLPPLVQALRTGVYPPLAGIANDWALRLAGAAAGEPPGVPVYPAVLQDWLARCHAGGQTRPTPLLLRYTEGGHNRLHQDRYGPLLFPLQMTVFLSRPGVDYDGGAFLLVEQHPRQQSRGEALLPAQGEAVLFPSAVRPVQGRRGWYRAQVRHGVATVTRGVRHTLGLIFHDAA